MPSLSADDLRRIVAWLRLQLFRVPLWGHRLLWPVGVVLLVVAAAVKNIEGAIAGATVAGFGLTGVARWWLARRRCRGGVAITLFSAADLRRAREIQDHLMTRIRERVPPQEFERVAAVRVVLGPAPRQEALAKRIWRGLGATYLVHGEVLIDGGVRAWVLQSSEHERVRHADPHTRDITPSKTTWRTRLLQLTEPPEDVRTMYPLAFINDLEAVVRAVAWPFASTHEEAERLLRDALAASVESGSLQVDHFRVLLAQLLHLTGRHDEAITELRRRAENEDAAPELLRALAAMLWGGEGGFASGETDIDVQEERVVLLRRAVEQTADPQYELSLYNLATAIAGRSEEDTRQSEEYLDRLLQSNTHYRDAWYVKRDRGARSWWRAGRAEAEGDTALAQHEALDAARWYDQAIKARKKAKWLYRDSQGGLHLRYRFRSSPVLHANAADAFRMAGRQRAARRHERRLATAQKKLEAAGFKAWHTGNYHRAYSYFDWMIVSKWEVNSARAGALAAILLKQLGENDRANQAWDLALRASWNGATEARACVDADAGLSTPDGLPAEPTEDDFAELAAEKSGLARQYWEAGDFSAALTLWKWTIRGTHDQYGEAPARAFVAALLKQVGDDLAAEEEWQIAMRDGYDQAMMARRAIAESLPCPRGLPGDEPTEADAPQ